VFLEFDVSQKI